MLLYTAQFLTQPNNCFVVLQQNVGKNRLVTIFSDISRLGLARLRYDNANTQQPRIFQKFVVSTETRFSSICIYARANLFFSLFMSCIAVKWKVKLFMLCNVYRLYSLNDNCMVSVIFTFCMTSLEKNKLCCYFSIVTTYIYMYVKRIWLPFFATHDGTKTSKTHFGFSR